MRWASLVLASLLLASVAGAQDTGGSFGGGDWGSGGDTDYGGGGSYDYGGGGSYDTSSDWGNDDWGSDDSGGVDWGSDDDDYSSSGSGDGGGWLWIVVFVVVGFGVSFMYAIVKDAHHARVRASTARYRSRMRRPPAAGRIWNGIDVAVLRLGLDWRGRKFVQTQLEELAKSGRTKSKQGLVELLRETARLLADARLGWLYADVCNHQPMNQAQAQGTFQRLAVDARARFQEEIIRAADGTMVELDGTQRSAKSHEGQGTVVVTLIVAARRELLDVIRERDANEIQNLLAQLRGVSVGELVALEVVWSPADDNDRMSTAELEARYPELSRIEERTIGGRVFCGHCGGPFADELGACPHCGAPHERAS